eukprot:gnl/TRDRNA2_/TRDRNA2_175451_c0_seq2.p1 gnl/TRDRNA2_/TRDRNA2_175451_c0~~gnl/TRDRNA2_/TRDRNA2_175451_c0_seq2.p1  ORF type:complete len:706 (-),score=104.00 gnl/TRDRNA2_/TRDRNA2_175451_c0_seq2:45-2105(-)
MCPHQLPQPRHRFQQDADRTAELRREGAAGSDHVRSKAVAGLAEPLRPVALVRSRRAAAEEEDQTLKAIQETLAQVSKPLQVAKIVEDSVQQQPQQRMQQDAARREERRREGAAGGDHGRSKSVAGLAEPWRPAAPSPGGHAAGKEDDWTSIRLRTEHVLPQVQRTASLPTIHIVNRDPAMSKVWCDKHAAAALDFYELMLQIRSEGAQKFQNGMWSLWQAAEALDHAQNGPNTNDKNMDPTAASLYSSYLLFLDIPPFRPSCGSISEDPSPYAAFSERWLLSFEANARTLKDMQSAILAKPGPAASDLCTLATALGAPIDRGCPNMPDHTKLRAMPFGLSHDALTAPEEFGSAPGVWGVLPFIWLPLALYVRSTTHLYEMLERLQLRAPWNSSGDNCSRPRRGGMSTFPPIARGCPPPLVLRKLLDRDERRYSYLVFSVTAALQALLLAKAELGNRFPLPLLASSPPDPEEKRPNGYPMVHKNDWSLEQLIFRGIWIGGEVDEERTRFQYSFQSFSRKVEGVAKVLSFHAGINDSAPAQIAARHKHLLILVARADWSKDSCLAMPVQLFEGPMESGSEMEVLLPPYVRYELEDDLTLSSADFGLAGTVHPRSTQLKLAQLRARWNGFELPELLLTMLQRGPLWEFPEIDALRPFVSVRFVRSITLPEPLRTLFTDSSHYLYSFDA